MDDRIVVTTQQVRALISSQFPHWETLDVQPVELSDRDNHSFHFSHGMLIRMLSASRYVAQVEKKHRWLLELAQLLPFSIPEPLPERGQPRQDYPFFGPFMAGARANLSIVSICRLLPSMLRRF